MSPKTLAVRKHAVWGLAVWAVASTASAQPTLRVHAESRIELRTERHEGHVTIHGALRDDLGSPLAERDVELEVSPAEPTRGSDALIRSRGRTGADGGFRLDAPLTEGTYLLRAAFEGDPLHARVEVVRTLDLARADVRLRVRVPNRGRLDLDASEHPITVLASSEAGGAGIEIQVQNELDRVLARGTTNEDGVLAVALASDDLGPQGPGRIKVRSWTDALRAEALTEVPIVRFRPSSLTLEADRSRLEPGSTVQLSGQLSNSQGPIGERAVGLFDGEQHLTTVLTDAEGRYAEAVELHGDDRTATIVARFESDSPGRGDASSPEVTVKLGPRASARWPWMLLPIVVCGLLLAWIARRSPVPRERGARAVPRPPPGVSVGTKTARSPDRHDIGGRVVDVGDDAPVPSAVVRVSLADGTNREATVDADGRFQLRDLPHGEGQLLVRASGYRELTHTVVLPHRGEWSEVVVRLDSLRAYALAAFRRAVLERLPSHEVWPVRTNRELVEQASSRDPRSDQTLGTLERRVEVAYYAPEPPGPADIHAIEALAEDVHRPSTSGPLSEKPPE